MPSSIFNNQLFCWEHRGHPFVLPATHRTLDAAGAGFAFLRSGAADIDVFKRCGRRSDIGLR